MYSNSSSSSMYVCMYVCTAVDTRPQYTFVTYKMTTTTTTTTTVLRRFVWDYPGESVPEG